MGPNIGICGGRGISAMELQVQAVRWSACWLARLDAKPPRYSFANQISALDIHSLWQSKVQLSGFGVAIRMSNRKSGKSCLYAPEIGNASEKLKIWMQNSDVLLLDGTCFTDNELESQGLGTRRATQMGHLPLAGDGGLLEQISEFKGRKVLVHINNSNPILNSQSVEREILNKASVEVATDGLEITL